MDAHEQIQQAREQIEEILDQVEAIIPDDTQVPEHGADDD